MFKMELEYKDNILFARLKGNLNKRSSYKINNYLNTVLKKHNIKYLILNLEKLINFDKTGIDSLIRSKYIIKNNKGKIRICNDQSYINKIIKIPVIRSESEAFKLMEAK